MTHTEVAVIGGGIVGLATAYHWSQLHPNRKVVVLEKEAAIAQHQTGHNSGVLHSGIYYKPGSLKATNCRAGKKRMEAFCEQENIPFELCGKVIVATHEGEFEALHNIYERGQENGVSCEMIDQHRLLELEPHVQGLRAIHVPEAGIVDYKAVCQRLAERIQETGENQIKCGAAVTNVEQRTEEIILQTTTGEVSCRYVINCAGLQSDKVMALTGQTADVQIVPFRGEYFLVNPAKKHLCQNLIYPVPNPEFPFLGVHFTRMIDGALECGPNAVLAFAREGYRKTDVVPTELWEALRYPGFQKLALKYWKIGLGEMWRSLSKEAFVTALQRLIPEVTSEDLTAAPAGVRAQAVSKDGQLIDDFLIQESERVLNVCNAPSPAATASLNIGRLLAEKLETRL
jgi:L-2-hydroxyglutarate oxidase